MTGVIPSFQNTAQLHFLNVSRNKFVGPIPEDLMKQSFANPTIHSAPFEVDVSFNALVGTGKVILNCSPFLITRRRVLK